MHELDSRHGYAMPLMVIGSVAISFGGLVQRNIEVAAPWQINLYRSLGLIAAIAAILELLDKPRPRQTPGQPGQTSASNRGDDYLERPVRGAPIP